MRKRWSHSPLTSGIVEILKRRLTFTTKRLPMIPIALTCGGSDSMRKSARRRRAKFDALRELLISQPTSGETLRRLIQLYSSVGETNKAEPLLQQAQSRFSEDADMLRFIIRYYEERGELAKTLEPARHLTRVETSNVQNYLLLARACFVLNKKSEFYEAAHAAIRLGGPSLRKAFLSDPTFSTWKNDPEFKKLAEEQSLPPD